MLAASCCRIFCVVATLIHPTVAYTTFIQKNRGERNGVGSTAQGGALALKSAQAFSVCVKPSARRWARAGLVRVTSAGNTRPPMGSALSTGRGELQCGHFRGLLADHLLL